MRPHLWLLVGLAGCTADEEPLMSLDLELGYSSGTCRGTRALTLYLNGEPGAYRTDYHWRDEHVVLENLSPEALRFERVNTVGGVHHTLAIELAIIEERGGYNDSVFGMGTLVQQLGSKACTSDVVAKGFLRPRDP